jgi:DNA invertase Pin-like site-specific DNA recombinase
VTTQNKTTAIYVRSGTHRRPGDLSLAAQEQACRAYAAALGWRVGEVFADVGIAGTQADRPGMNRLLGALRDGVVERVLIARAARLSRSHADIKAILHVLEEWGVQCESVEQPGYLQAPRRAESE